MIFHLTPTVLTIFFFLQLCKQKNHQYYLEQKYNDTEIIEYLLLYPIDFQKLSELCLVALHQKLNVDYKTYQDFENRWDVIGDIHCS